MFFPFFRFIIHGNSMLPTLKPGQNILVFAWSYLLSQPKIGDIVVIRHNGDKIIKRVKKVFKKGYFIQGDNKRESIDSRSFGLVNKSQIIGKVIWQG